jgi:hypothetical protein
MSICADAEFFLQLGLFVQSPQASDLSFTQRFSLALRFCGRVEWLHAPLLPANAAGRLSESQYRHFKEVQPSMAQYILLIHGNIKTPSTVVEWGSFFAAAQESGMFKGGSEFGSRTLLGDTLPAQSTVHIVAYMRFDADDKRQLLELLEMHPVVLHGGTAELCEMIESQN